MHIRYVIGLLVLSSAAPALAQKKNPTGAAVLLLSGGQREHHAYRDQAFYLANLLEDTGRFRVTICEDAAILETPAMKKYTILAVTADRRDPEFKFTKPQQEAILSYVKAGHGYVSIHGGDNAPADWLPEWKEMLGGIYSHTGKPDGKAILGSWTARVADSNHPITRGLADFALNDELYMNMQMKEDVKPLLTIEHQGTAWPVAWTYSYGSGKVFHTSLGHRGLGRAGADPLRDPNVSKLIVQAFDWLAGALK